MQLCRTTDAIFRYEDNRFLVILHNTNKGGAQANSRRIMKGVQKEGLEAAMQYVQKEPLRVALSIGFAVLTGTDSSASIMERACKALGNAKASGGNAIRF